MPLMDMYKRYIGASVAVFPSDHFIAAIAVIWTTLRINDKVTVRFAVVRRERVVTG